jgi:thiamine biosynthesis lipoprotein
MAEAEHDAVVAHVEHVMGTAVRFVSGTHPLPAEIEKAVAWLHWVDRTFSVYRPHSEIMRIRRGELDTPHFEVTAVLERCLGLRILTEGAFDHRLEDALDPSGYVKGWAIQRAADMLADRGLERFYIDAGGDIAMRGAWTIGVRNPSTPARALFALELDDQAVATSGTYERGQHIWGADPGGLASVTVVGHDLGTADAVATALFSSGGRNVGWLDRFPGYRIYTVGNDLRVRAA